MTSNEKKALEKLQGKKATKPEAKASKAKPEQAKPKPVKGKDAKGKNAKKAVKPEPQQHRDKVEGWNGIKSSRLDADAKRSFSASESKKLYAKVDDLVATFHRPDGSFEIWMIEDGTDNAAYLFNLPLTESEMKRESKLPHGHDYQDVELVSKHSGWFPAMCDMALYASRVERDIEKAMKGGKLEMAEEPKTSKRRKAA